MVINHISHMVINHINHINHTLRSMVKWMINRNYFVHTKLSGGWSIKLQSDIPQVLEGDGWRYDGNVRILLFETELM